MTIGDMSKEEIDSYMKRINMKIKILDQKYKIDDFSEKVFGSCKQTPELFDALIEEGIMFYEENIEIPIETLSKKVQMYLRLR